MIEGVDIVQFSWGNVDKAGDVAAEIDQRVQLDGPLAAAESRPGKEAQAQVDGRRVEGVNGLFECDGERFGSIQGSGTLDQDLGEVGEDAPVVGAVGVGQRAAGNGSSEAGVVELGTDGAEAGFDVAEAFAEGELGEGQAEELIAARESARPAVAVVTTDAGVEIVTRKELHQLGEDQRTGVHEWHSTAGEERSGVDCDRWS